MRMNVFEMEGFLRGRCVPRDLKVNKTDAEYLVRKFDALEAKCAAQENKVIPVSTELPPANESVLLFDANGEGWLIVTNGAIVIHTQRLKSDPGGNLLS